MRIFFNCLSVIEAGQVTRANKFISNSIWKKDKSKLVILKNEIYDFKLINNISLHNHEHIKVKFLKILPFQTFQRIIWENIFINKYIREKNCDIYLTTSNYFPFIKPNIPTIIGITNMAPFSIDAYKSSSILQKLRLKFLKYSILTSCKKATKVFALSNTCKKELIKLGIDKSKIKVIPNGVEHNNYIKKIDYSEKKVISYVSHFYNYKNHELLLKAFSKIPPSIRENYNLLLVGKFLDKNYVKRLFSLSHKLDISSNCKFVNGLNKTELTKVYKKANLFIFPSLIENCPNILLEALSYGLPILCSNKMPMPEFGKDSVEYFDPKDEITLSKKIIYLLNNKEKLISMSIKSKKLSKVFSWDKFSREILSMCYSSLKKL